MGERGHVRTEKMMLPCVRSSIELSASDSLLAKDRNEEPSLSLIVRSFLIGAACQELYQQEERRWSESKVKNTWEKH